jgi:hypothetical protein
VSAASVFADGDDAAFRRIFRDSAALARLMVLPGPGLWRLAPIS